MNDIVTLNFDSHKNVLFWDSGKLTSIYANCLPQKEHSFLSVALIPCLALLTESLFDWETWD